MLRLTTLGLIASLALSVTTAAQLPSDRSLPSPPPVSGGTSVGSPGTTSDSKEQDAGAQSGSTQVPGEAQPDSNETPAPSDHLDVEVRQDDDGSSTAESTPTPAFTISGPMDRARTSIGDLGEATGPEISAGAGSYQVFSGGAAFLSPSGGVFAVRGAMLGAYLSQGGPTSYLGYPLGNEGPSVRGAVYQEFEGGIGYWSTATGAHFVHGAVYRTFVGQGWAGGRLGLPVGDEVADTDNGLYQAFQGGRVYWRPAYPGLIVRGAMLGAYLSQGGPTSYLGYPLGNEGPSVRGAVYQEFEGGIGYWSTATGAHFLHGALRTWYADSGWEHGVHGFPASDEYPDHGSVRQDFEHGSFWWGGMPARTYTHSVEWAGQPNNYFCGPTSGFMILRYAGAWRSASGTGLSIDALAGRSYMNTVGYGYTSFHDRRFSAGMNAWLGRSVYHTIHTPSVGTVQDAVKRSFTTGYPTAVDAQERRGGPHYNGHPNSTFSHIMVVSGYDTATDEVQMVDPGAGVLWGGSRAFWYPSLATFTRSFLQTEVELDGLEHIGIHTS
ncbi:MAG: C39 family peptidase [Propionibacterium sp.]|nr:C39 family peptidase [Propionibacterium sp.]